MSFFLLQNLHYFLPVAMVLDVYAIRMCLLGWMVAQNGLRGEEDMAVAVLTQGLRCPATKLVVCFALFRRC